MTLPFAMGLLSGVLSVFVICLVMKKKSSKSWEYDERQIAVRGQAYKAGFLTFIVCQFIVFFAELFTEKPIVILAPGVASIIIMLLSLLVFLEVAIFKDAYFTPSKPMSKRWLVFMFIFTILVFLSGFRADDIWYKAFNYSAACFFAIILASCLIKALISKKSETEDDE